MSLRRSLVWSYGGQAGSFLIGFAASIVIARLLTPAQFGIFALANSITGLLSIIATVGLTQFVIREKELSREVLRSVFTVNLLLQLLLAIALGLFGMLAAPGFGAGVREVLLLLALNPLLAVIEFLPRALLQRDMQFSAISLTGVVNAAVSALVTIPLAMMGWGAMSIAVAVLAAHAACAAMVVVRMPGYAVMLPTTRGLGAIALFGSQMLTVAGATQAANRLSDMALGKLQGTEQLGLYARASQLFSQLYYIVYGMATGVLFARLSQDYNRTGELRQTYLRAVEMLTGILWPAAIGLAVLARPVIFIVYGERWLPAALPLSLLMVAMFINLAFAMNWELFVLRNETGRQARFELARAVLGTTAFIAGAWHGIVWAAAARVAEAVFTYLLYRPHMPRVVGCEARDLRRVQGRGMILTALAAAPALLLMVATGFDPHTGPALVAGAIGAGGLLWLAGLFAIDHPLAAELRLLRARLVRAAA